MHKPKGALVVGINGLGKDRGMTVSRLLLAKEQEIGGEDETVGYWAGKNDSASGILPVARDTKRLCLAWRNKEVHTGNCWGIPGGAVKEGLTPAASAEAELKEEVGYTGEVELHAGYVFKDGDFHYFNFVGIVDREFSFKPGSTHAWETDRILWVSFEQVVAEMDGHPEDFHPGMLQFFKNSRDLIESLVRGQKKANLRSPTEAQLSALKGMELRAGSCFKKWLKEYIGADPDPSFDQVWADESQRLDYFDDWLRDDLGIDTQDDGSVMFYYLTPKTERIIGDLPVLLYHHTSSHLLPKIKQEGLRADVQQSNPHENSGAGVYLTSEGSGPAVDGYIAGARSRSKNGEGVALLVRTYIRDLVSDPDDADLSSGKHQFILPSVLPSDIIFPQRKKPVPKKPQQINDLAKLRSGYSWGPDISFGDLQVGDGLSVDGSAADVVAVNSNGTITLKDDKDGSTAEWSASDFKHLRVLMGRNKVVHKLRGSMAVAASQIESNESLKNLLEPSAGGWAGKEKEKKLAGDVSVFIDPNGSYRFVKFVDGQPVAAMQVMSHDKKSGYVGNIFVAPDHRRAGYGSELVRNARKMFKELLFSSDRSHQGEAFVRSQEGKKASNPYPKWIGVDLDDSLAESIPGNDYSDPTLIGSPIPEMVEKVRRVIAEGATVKVFTARMADKENAERIAKAIGDYTEEHVGKRLDATNEKDPGCVAIWDDKARRVEKGTGKFATALTSTPSVSEDLIWLKDYLTMSNRDKGEELARQFYFTFREYVESNYPEELDKVPDPDQDEYLEDYTQIPDAILTGFLNDEQEYLMRNEPALCPSFMHMGFEKVLPKQWLIHKTNDPDGVCAKGFTIGIDDYRTLGLTTYFRDGAKTGGYNFAFLASDARLAERRYGKHAVVFRASGIQVYHYGDEERQVVFRGSEAHDLIPVYNTYDGWTLPEDDQGNPVFQADDLATVVAWIEKNYAKYRKAIVKRATFVKAAASPDIQIENNCYDSHGGELFCTIRAFNPQREVVGYIDYSHYDDEIHIKYVETAEGHQRQGIATRLIEQLRTDNPGTPIDWGMLTDDGAALKAKVHQPEDEPKNRLLSQLEQAREVLAGRAQDTYNDYPLPEFSNLQGEGGLAEQIAEDLEWSVANDTSGWARVQAEGDDYVLHCHDSRGDEATLHIPSSLFQDQVDGQWHKKEGVTISPDKLVVAARGPKTAAITCVACEGGDCLAHNTVASDSETTKEWKGLPEETDAQRALKGILLTAGNDKNPPSKAENTTYPEYSNGWALFPDQRGDEEKVDISKMVPGS